MPMLVSEASLLVSRSKSIALKNTAMELLF
jgi:hypothetical protein